MSSSTIFATVSPGRYNLMIHSMVEICSKKIQFNSRFKTILIVFLFSFLVFLFGFVFVHVNVISNICQYPRQKFRVPTLPRVYFGTKRVSVIHNPKGILFTWKSGAFYYLFITCQLWPWRESQGFCTNWCWRSIFCLLPHVIQSAEKNSLLSDISNSFLANRINLQKIQ